MIYSNLVTLLLLVASTLVLATPVVPRDDDGWSSGFITALNNAGLTKLSGLYADFFKSTQGPDLIQELKCRHLTILAPTNNAFDPSNISIGSDPSSLFRYNSIQGAITSKKRAASPTRDIAPTLMEQQEYYKRAPNYQVQVVDTVSDINWKRWNNDTTIFIRRTIGSAKVLSQTKYRDVDIAEIDTLLTLPTKIDDVLCKPLVDAAPNGFTKLGPALYQTGLMDTVSCGKSVTLFAPIDDAFQGYDGTSTEQLTSILKNHVVFSNYYSPSFSTKPTVETASGKTLKFEVDGNNTYICCGQSKARVLRSDVITANGAIHVIDKVLKCD
ncbi:FAS1 domain-containing protein [Ceratobasidium sp. AG-I]|nr:FAS1 domain-containing protein [Ceratobasidium sp. AG-I]